VRLELWVYAEQRRGKLVSASLELLGLARGIADKARWALSSVLLGHNVEVLCKELIAHGADRVYLVEHPLLELYQCEPYSRILAKLASEAKPEAILFPHTAVGSDLAPRVAAKLRTGLSAHVVNIELDERRLLRQIVPGFGGSIMAVVLCPERRPQMATIMPGVARKPKPDWSRRGEVIRVEEEVSEEELRARTLELVEEPPEEKPLEEADIVVAGGWGLRSREGFRIVEELAEALSAAVGGTRPALDEGWIKPHQMIGHSGKTIRPKLYIAIGISGEMHHTVGILDSGVIVAVNNDPSAPIFEVCDYGVVGDAFEVIPRLTSMLRELRGAQLKQEP